MNFLDSLLDKIPVIKDMDKKKRILAAGFLVFAIVSLLGILIDALASAGGVIALISVAIGFLLMAAIIIADFIMSRKPKQQDYPPKQEQYNFFDDETDDYGYQDESQGFRENPDGDYTATTSNTRSFPILCRRRWRNPAGSRSLSAAALLQDLNSVRSPSRNRSDPRRLLTTM